MHWRVENDNHKTLDVVLGEDVDLRSMLRVGVADVNLQPCILDALPAGAPALAVVLEMAGEDAMPADDGVLVRLQ